MTVDFSKCADELVDGCSHISQNEGWEAPRNWIVCPSQAKVKGIHSKGAVFIPPFEGQGPLFAELNITKVNAP
jgi:hypothetical protein